MTHPGTESRRTKWKIPNNKSVNHQQSPLNTEFFALGLCPYLSSHSVRVKAKGEEKGEDVGEGKRQAKWEACELVF